MVPQVERWSKHNPPRHHCNLRKFHGFCNKNRRKFGRYTNFNYTVVKVDGATPKRWRFVRGHGPNQYMGLANLRSFPGGVMLKLVVWGPVLWIPGISLMKRGIASYTPRAANPPQSTSPPELKFGLLLISWAPRGRVPFSNHENVQVILLLVLGYR